ncbi:hypothetical protein KIN20_000033 [Parelaphostrongylus tenuis]|uniref:Uncharacterized protein n=1 Tax=Parelaphostrongylus tenuis TaxID=148309 RepID=A0AAD5MAL8_PARTN|nr:hypothetical protein KIN20_000033 [Parelaphostrongylus tenuis]
MRQKSAKSASRNDWNGLNEVTVLIAGQECHKPVKFDKILLNHKKRRNEILRENCGVYCNEFHPASPDGFSRRNPE